MEIQFTIKGKPQGKARVRVTSYAAYTPKKTKEYEDEIRWAYRLLSRGRKIGPYVYAKIISIYPVPKSVSAKTRDEMLSRKILPAVKPDVDNVEKVVFDALNRIAYDDDKQVVFCASWKIYGKVPRVIVTLSDEEMIPCPIES